MWPLSGSTHRSSGWNPQENGCATVWNCKKVISQIESCPISGVKLISLGRICLSLKFDFPLAWSKQFDAYGPRLVSCSGHWVLLWALSGQQQAESKHRPPWWASLVSLKSNGSCPVISLSCWQAPWPSLPAPGEEWHCQPPFNHRLLTLLLAYSLWKDKSAFVLSFQQHHGQHLQYTRPACLQTDKIAGLATYTVNMVHIGPGKSLN